jgi:hypothetical protein
LYLNSRRAIHRAGAESTLEPTLRRLPGLEAGAYGASRGREAAGLEARVDILLALESGMSVVDVSITHPSGVSNRAAAATMDGAAAARRDRENRRTYGQLEPNGYPFIPFSVETYGRLGKLLQDLMQHLSPRVCTILGSQARLYKNEHDWAGSTFQWFDLSLHQREARRPG